MPRTAVAREKEESAPGPKEIGRAALEKDTSDVALSELGHSDEESILLGANGSVCCPASPARQQPKPEVPHARVILLVCGHALSAACLLVVNKWAQKVFPFVWTLTTLQFSFASSLVYVLGKLGVLEVSQLELNKLIQFFPAAGMFFITITAGNAVVGRTNVDTFIVMRSLVPIPAAILESLLLKEPWPRPQSFVGLGIIIAGAAGYARSNFMLVFPSASWVILFLILSPVDAVIIKHIVNSSGLSPWSLVLYNNICAVLPGVLFSFLLEFRVTEDREAMLLALESQQALLPLALSCCIGLSISYFQLNVRGLISSTAFMVLGVSNKFLSVALGQVANFDANGDIVSLGSTLLSITGGIIFQQTVKGKGISQATKTDFNPSTSSSCVLVGLGIMAAACISAYQG